MAKKPTWNFPKHLKDSQNVRNKVLYSDETQKWNLLILIQYVQICGLQLCECNEETFQG